MTLTREKEEEKEDRDRPAITFFNEVIAPLALRERAEGKTFFPLRADAEAESYYVEPTHRVMSPSDFELRAGESIEDFINELSALWIAEGYSELAGMARGLSELAANMGEQRGQEEDVSAFMYVMF